MPEDQHPPHSTGGLSDKFTDLIGLEELEDFRLSHIFSEVFKKHTTEEMEEQLITGTTRHTPDLSEMEVRWARPWLFARLLGASAVLAFILYAGFEMFDNLNLIPGLIFVGSFAVPLSTLIFFLEMNVPRFRRRRTVDGQGGQAISAGDAAGPCLLMHLPLDGRHSYALECAFRPDKTAHRSGPEVRPAGYIGLDHLLPSGAKGIEAAE